jgi:hypothetical protein
MPPLQFLNFWIQNKSNKLDKKINKTCLFHSTSGAEQTVSPPSSNHRWWSPLRTMAKHHPTRSSEAWKSGWAFQPLCWELLRDAENCLSSHNSKWQTTYNKMTGRFEIYFNVVYRSVLSICHLNRALLVSISETKSFHHCKQYARSLQAIDLLPSCLVSRFMSIGPSSACSEAAVLHARLTSRPCREGCE